MNERFILYKQGGISPLRWPFSDCNFQCSGILCELFPQALSIPPAESQNLYCLDFFNLLLFNWPKINKWNRCPCNAILIWFHRVWFWQRKSLVLRTTLLSRLLKWKGFEKGYFLSSELGSSIVSSDIFGLSGQKKLKTWHGFGCTQTQTIPCSNQRFSRHLCSNTIWD